MIFLTRNISIDFSATGHQANYALYERSTALFLHEAADTSRRAVSAFVLGSDLLES